MNWLQTWKKEGAAHDKQLGRHTLESDLELENISARVKEVARIKAQEHDLFIKEIYQDIEIAQEYINIGSWKKALETLKHRSDRHDTPLRERKLIEEMYRKARALMEDARAIDPSVPLFTHFNLPTDDVN
jgi:hypothetical protein